MKLCDLSNKDVCIPYQWIFEMGLLGPTNIASIAKHIFNSIKNWLISRWHIVTSCAWVIQKSCAWLPTIRNHYSDVTWPSWRLKSPLTRLVVQQLVDTCEGNPMVNSGPLMQKAFSQRYYGCIVKKGATYVLGWQSCIIKNIYFIHSSSKISIKHVLNEIGALYI